MDTKFIKLLILFLILLTLLLGCGKNPDKSNSQIVDEDVLIVDDTTEIEESANEVFVNESLDTNVTNPPNSEIDKNCEKIYLTEDSDTKIVSIEVPIFDIEKKDEVTNDIIKCIEDYFAKWFALSFSFAQSDTDCMEGANYNELVNQYEHLVEIKCQIMNADEDCISIVFDGMVNVRKTAHPNNIFFTYNFNPKTGERILFSDIYCVDERLVYCYYTEAAVGISVDVPFGLADHLEFEIPYELLEKKTNKDVR